MLMIEILFDDWFRIEDFVDLFIDIMVVLKFCFEVGCWSVWDKDVVDIFEGVVIVVVKLGCFVKDFVGKDVGCKVVVIIWFLDKEFVVKVESEFVRLMMWRNIIRIFYF